MERENISVVWIGSENDVGLSPVVIDWDDVEFVSKHKFVLNEDSIAFAALSTCSLPIMLTKMLYSLGYIVRVVNNKLFKYSDGRDTVVSYLNTSAYANDGGKLNFYLDSENSIIANVSHDTVINISINDRCSDMYVSYRSPDDDIVVELPMDRCVRKDKLHNLTGYFVIEDMTRCEYTSTIPGYDYGDNAVMSMIQACDEHTILVNKTYDDFVYIIKPRKTNDDKNTIHRLHTDIMKYLLKDRDADGISYLTCDLTGSVYDMYTVDYIK